LRNDKRWIYGTSPAGNANFAWVQHFIHHLAPSGTAGFVLANGSMSSNQSGEGEIRKAIVEADLVDCMVALPGQLFYATQIPVCLCFLARDKKNGRFRDRRGETLFIDARKLGTMVDRVHRELTDADIAKIAGTYHAWRGDKDADEYADVPGFCKSASLDDIRKHGHVLTPGRYVGAGAAEEDDEPFDDKMRRLVATLQNNRPRQPSSMPQFSPTCGSSGMRREWRSSTWGEEVSLEYGKALRGHETAQGPFRVFGANGPIGWTSQPLAPGPGVILGRKGAYRGVQFSPEPFFVIDTAYDVKPKSELDMRWLYYAIKYHELGAIDDGSPIPSTTRAAVYVCEVDVPPIEEQRAIGRILGALDDKIKLNRRMNETLEAMARALFKSWCVDFDPVRTLADVADLNAESWSAKNYPAEVRYVDLSNTQWGVIQTIDVYSNTNAPSRAQRVLRAGDTIVGTVRPGNGSFAMIGEEGLTGSTGFAVLRPKWPS